MEHGSDSTIEWKILYFRYIVGYDMTYAFRRLSHYGNQWELYAMWPVVAPPPEGEAK